MGRTSAMLFLWGFAAAGFVGPAGQASPRRDLLLLRHATDGSVSLHVGQSVGPVLLIAGTVRPSGPGHHGAIGAVGGDIRLAATTRLLVVVGHADVSSGRFVRLYLLPSVRAGRVVGSKGASPSAPTGERR